MSTYKHLFFDLDHTLWDFRGNSRETLRELVGQHDLLARGIPDSEAFISVYEEINHALWADHGAGRMPKEVLRVLRFRSALQRFGITDNRLPASLSEDYLAQCPRKPGLMPGARELIHALEGRFRMHIITNGFEEVQQVKLASAGLDAHFDVVLTSERAGAAKPSQRIFQEALRQAGANATESLMIGDNVEADMQGARNAGWDHAHYTAETEPDLLATYRIAHLADLGSLLL
ncbi:MAG: noncanonical pyrimidine nucleotidase, YjjG family [Flavobacteriales bacterium]|nr:noncanonical pyrimidine nucleotidase, YjjG family [Flavobacteriales bacterium]